MEGLLNLSPALNYKISIEEQMLVQFGAQLALNEQRYEELVRGLKVKQEVSSEVVSSKATCDRASLSCCRYLFLYLAIQVSSPELLFCRES